MKKIPYGRQHITEDDIDSVINVLKSDWLTQGPKIEEFEESFASYVGSKYAVSVSSGTAALHLSIIALKVNPGDKVITTPITFAASANCIRYADGNVVFADINPETYLLDLDHVRKKLEAVPKGTIVGIIPVDFAGRAVNLEAFRELANEFNCWIIEDACHSPGGYFMDSSNKKQNCGNGEFADLSIFSFHPVKHIAAGEGGMVTTNNYELYNKIKILRTHGIQQNRDLEKSDLGGWYYEMKSLGYNYRLTDLQAALGCSQLKRANNGLTKRKEIAAYYYESLKDIKGIIRQSGLVEGHAYHLYVIEVENRKDLYNYLRNNNILVQVHYIPTHFMPYYKEFGWKPGDLPDSEDYYEHCLSIPIYPTLTKEEQDFVIIKIKEFYS